MSGQTPIKLLCLSGKIPFCYPDKYVDTRSQVCWPHNSATLTGLLMLMNLLLLPGRPQNVKGSHVLVPGCGVDLKPLPPTLGVSGRRTWVQGT